MIIIIYKDVMLMKWLHISDLHFQFKNYDTANLRDKMLNYLSKNGIKLDFIIITGDILYRYNSKDNEILDFIKEIRIKCGVKPDAVYIVPGNHDVNRNDTKRNKIINNN